MYYLLYEFPIFISENSGQILVWDSNAECMQIELEFEF